MAQKVYKCALYARLSRDDGDKTESDSITNQINLLEGYCGRADDMEIAQHYIDDGYTGTNFNRPAFIRMMEDVDSGKVNCIIVKDLSRFGRDYIDAGKYLERILPMKGVRFIAINDNIDSNKGAYDMLLPIKNIFNSQYARDISGKVRSSFDTKRKQGEFIGAFCSYGYCKDPHDRNHLVIDEGAAKVVQRIFDMFESGIGKDSIARKLNHEGIPCPSEYKRLLGENYKNGLKMDSTTYWTYSTVHRMLRNRMYAGDMVQGKYRRPIMHGKACLQEKEKWLIKENTHEPIISCEQWERVQRLLEVKAKKVEFASEEPLKGFIKCGKCGRKMAIRGDGELTRYSCVSYERYGPSACPKNNIKRNFITRIVLDDLNKMLGEIVNIHGIDFPESAPQYTRITEEEQLEKALERIGRLRLGVYEDYKDGILSKEEYQTYKADYEVKEKQLRLQFDKGDILPKQGSTRSKLWVTKLFEQGRIDELDRVTVAEILDSMYVYPDGRIEINYRFGNTAESRLEHEA